MWSSALGLDKFQTGSSYDTYVWKQIDDASFDHITKQLGLTQISRRTARSKMAVAMASSEQLVLHHPLYQVKEGRERLRRLMVAVVKWRGGQIAFDSKFIIFCSVVMAVTETERLSFRAVTALHSRLHLDEYYPEADPEAHGTGQQRIAVERDKERLWADLIETWPGVAWSFSRQAREDLFFELADSWLLSLFTTCFNMDHQPLLKFLPLLDRVITSSGCCEEDPRRNLRCMAVCIFGRYHELFEAAATEGALISVVTDLKVHTHVDEALLELIDARLGSAAQGSAIIRQCLSWVVDQLCKARRKTASLSAG